jgi:hypothetical protein
MSHPLITFANGSTTSVNYGSLSPGTQLQKIQIMYEVPKALAGKKEWVMIQADEGSKAQHVLMVYLDIQ